MKQSLAAVNFIYLSAAPDVSVADCGDSSWRGGAEVPVMRRSRDACRRLYRGGRSLRCFRRRWRRIAAAAVVRYMALAYFGLAY